MFHHGVEEDIQGITEELLRAYATALVQQAQQQQQQHQQDVVWAKDLSTSSTSAHPTPGIRQPMELAATTSPAEAALALLECIYGRTLLSALGIVLYGAEPIIRYVERWPNANGDARDAADLQQASTSATQQQQQQQSAAPPALGLRYFFRIGDYVLLTPFYCPCSAYAFQSVRREEVYACKHRLALQIALALEASGIAQDNVRQREVDSNTFNEMLRASLLQRTG